MVVCLVSPPVFTFWVNSHTIALWIEMQIRFGFSILNSLQFEWKTLNIGIAILEWEIYCIWLTLIKETQQMYQFISLESAPYLEIEIKFGFIKIAKCFVAHWLFAFFFRSQLCKWIYVIFHSQWIENRFDFNMWLTVAARLHRNERKTNSW